MYVYNYMMPCMSAKHVAMHVTIYAIIHDVTVYVTIKAL